MDANWKEDSCLKSMSKEKLVLFIEFADRIEHMEKNKSMEVFISINLEVR